MPDTNTLKKEIVSAVTGVTELGKRLKAEVQDVVVANADYRRLKAVLKALK